MVVGPNRKEIFEDCVTQCADSIYRVAYRLTGEESLARDLVQETYLNAWKSLDSLQDVSKVKSWMFAILRNQYTKLIRKEARTVPSSDLSEAVANPKDIESKETADLVQLAIQRLDDSFRLPLLLVSMEGFSVEEAAKILELPKGTVLSRLHRGRERLKSILSSEFAVA